MKAPAENQPRRNKENEGRGEEILEPFVPSWLIFIIIRSVAHCDVNDSSENML
jgi:hypothetical protein